MEKKTLVLVVEDKRDIATVISFHLDNEYEFCYKKNPIDALKWMHEGNIPNLIITDIYMPTMDGTEFIRHLKTSTMFKEVPVIVLSCMEDSNKRIELLELGAVDFIQKPFNPQELKIRVRNALKKR